MNNNKIKCNSLPIGHVVKVEAILFRNSVLMRRGTTSSTAMRKDIEIMKTHMRWGLIQSELDMQWMESEVGVSTTG